MFSFCMSCGAKLQPEWKFCGSCREPVPRDNAAQSRPAIRETGGAPAPAPTAVAEQQEPGGPAAADTADGFKRPGRKVIISAGVLLALGVAGIGAYFYIQNMIRGAGSAESAAEKLIEAVEDKDLAGIFTMVPPQERDALQRVRGSEAVKVQEYVSPPRIEGSDYSYSDSIYTAYNGNSADEVELQVPEGNDVELVITITDLYSSGLNSTGVLILTIDGNRYQVPVTEDEAEQVIPYPADSETQTLGLELDMGGKYGSVSYSLEFVRK